MATARPGIVLSRQVSVVSPVFQEVCSDQSQESLRNMSQDITELKHAFKQLHNTMTGQSAPPQSKVAVQPRVFMQQPAYAGYPGTTVRAAEVHQQQQVQLAQMSREMAELKVAVKQLALTTSSGPGAAESQHSDLGEISRELAEVKVAIRQILQRTNQMQISQDPGDPLPQHSLGPGPSRSSLPPLDLRLPEPPARTQTQTQTYVLTSRGSTQQVSESESLKMEEACEQDYFPNVVFSSEDVGFGSEGAQATRKDVGIVPIACAGTPLTALQSSSSSRPSEGCGDSAAGGTLITWGQPGDWASDLAGGASGAGAGASLNTSLSTPAAASSLPAPSGKGEGDSACTAPSPCASMAPAPVCPSQGQGGNVMPLRGDCFYLLPAAGGEASAWPVPVPGLGPGGVRAQSPVVRVISRGSSSVRAQSPRQWSSSAKPSPVASSGKQGSRSPLYERGNSGPVTVLRRVSSLESSPAAIAQPHSSLRPQSTGYIVPGSSSVRAKSPMLPESQGSSFVRRQSSVQPLPLSEGSGWKRQRSAPATRKLVSL